MASSLILPQPGDNVRPIAAELPEPLCSTLGHAPVLLFFLRAFS
jgi:hypothetical protein